MYLIILIFSIYLTLDFAYCETIYDYYDFNIYSIDSMYVSSDLFIEHPVTSSYQFKSLPIYIDCSSRVSNDRFWLITQPSQFNEQQFVIMGQVDTSSEFIKKYEYSFFNKTITNEDGVSIIALRHTLHDVKGNRAIYSSSLSETRDSIVGSSNFDESIFDDDELRNNLGIFLLKYDSQSEPTVTRIFLTPENTIYPIIRYETAAFVGEDLIAVSWVANTDFGLDLQLAFIDIRETPTLLSIYEFFDERIESCDYDKESNLISIGTRSGILILKREGDEIIHHARILFSDEIVSTHALKIRGNQIVAITRGNNLNPWDTSSWPPYKFRLIQLNQDQIPTTCSSVEMKDFRNLNLDFSDLIEDNSSYLCLFSRRAYTLDVTSEGSIKPKHFVRIVAGCSNAMRSDENFVFLNNQNYILLKDTFYKPSSKIPDWFLN